MKDTRLAQKEPVIYLDATADSLIVEKMFSGIEIAEAHVQLNAYTVQIWDRSFSKTALNAKKHYTQHIKNLIDVLEARYGKVAVITGKDHEEALEIEHGAHYNALRGRDHLKDADVGLVISRVQPRAYDVEQMARAIFPHEEISFVGDYERRPGGYRMRNKEELGIAEFYHPDPLVNRVLMQMREAEGYQGAGRLRAIHRDKSVPLFVLNNLPLDLDVDELVRWSDLVGADGKLVEALRRSGFVLPLSAKWMTTMLPDLWKTEKAAKDWVSKFIKNRSRSCNSNNGSRSCNSNNGSRSRNIYSTETLPVPLYTLLRYGMSGLHKRLGPDRFPYAFTCLPTETASRVRSLLEGHLAMVWPDDQLEYFEWGAEADFSVDKTNLQRPATRDSNDQGIH